MKNYLKQIYQDSGRLLTDDNRSYFVKNINLLLERGEITLKIQKKDMVWALDSSIPTYNRLEDGRLNKYNVIIRGYGMVRKTYIGGYSISPESLLQRIASFLLLDSVQAKRTEALKLNFTEYYPCLKCHGKKIIPSFMHICDGVCFECAGSGIRNAENKSIVLNSK